MSCQRRSGTGPPNWGKKEPLSENLYRLHRVADTSHSGMNVFKPDKINKSGYMELYSIIMEEKGLPPLPTWIAVPEHEKMKADDLILTTYKVAAQIHSRSANCKWLSEIYHDNPALINPATASAKSIGDGDRIKVKSEVGEIETTAKVTPLVVPGFLKTWGQGLLIWCILPAR